MAEITNPQIVTFSNERSRVIADRLAALYYDIVAYQNDYVAQNIANQIVAAGATELISDGSAIDGRSRITGNSVINLNAAITQIKTALDTTVIPGVGSTAISVINSIQVNGSPR